MAYQEVTRTSYGTRVKNSFGGIFIGIILFLASTAMLWWNEGRAVKTTKMLQDAEKNYVEMENVDTKNPEFEGKLVHAVALATTTDSLSDATFNVGSANTIKLRRKVEYFQWVEDSQSTSKDKIGGAKETTTTYTYKKKWTSSPVDSRDFKDPDYIGKNFVYQTFDSEVYSAEDVAFGAYRLNKSQISSFSNESSFNITLDKDIARQIEKLCKNVHISTQKNDMPIQQAIDSAALKATTDSTALKAATDSTALKAATSEQTPAQAEEEFKYVHVSGNVIYIGQHPNMPEVGDIRITFTRDMPSKVSILAKVTGDTFTSYKAKNGKRFSALYMGENSAEEMFESEHSTNSIITWFLRILGVMLVISGLKSIVSIVPTLLKVLPFLGQITESALGLICSVIGLAWSLIIIAIAWLRYRPILGIVLLAIAGSLIFLLAARKKNKQIATTNNNQN